MSFATIYKKKKTDLWAVQQGLPLVDGNATCGQVVWEGRGTAEVARLVAACRTDYSKHRPLTLEEIAQAPRIFGYRVGDTLERYAHCMDIWEEEDCDGFYGNISLGRKRSPFVLRVQLAYSEPELTTWVEEAWVTIQTAFANAEEFKM